VCDHSLPSAFERPLIDINPKIFASPNTINSSSAPLLRNSEILVVLKLLKEARATFRGKGIHRRTQDKNLLKDGKVF